MAISSEYFSLFTQAILSLPAAVAVIASRILTAC